MRILRIDSSSPYRALVGVGGIGIGCFFALEGNHTLGRNESRPGRLLNTRDYCKLHIVTHYIARSLGAGGMGNAFQVFPIGKVGADTAGQELLRQMRDAGMDTQFVKPVAGKPTLTSVCFQYPDGSGGNITTSNSAAAELSPDDVDDAAELLAAHGPRMIALAVPEVPLQVRRHLLALASRVGAFRAASFVSSEIASAREHGMFEMLDLMALNESEASELVDCPFSEQDPELFITKCLAHLGRYHPDLRLVVSAGKNGAYGFAGGSWNFYPAPAVQVSSTAGAGDALLGGIISAMAAGMPFVRAGLKRERLDEAVISTALGFGVILASYTITSPHTIHPNACVDAVLEFSERLGICFAPEFLARFARQVPDTGWEAPVGS